jgi:hypothetical protein
MPEIKIKISHFKKIWFTINRYLNALLVFLTLRKGHKFWGVVYDSVSKQPLDPVIVKLVYAQSGEPVQTCVTDLAGRYGFLARPGKFKIIAKKSNYMFPSVRAIGDTDGIFSDLYHGEFFELKDESEVLGPNIPMDPVAADWNQQAKLKVINTYPYLRLLFLRLRATVFWFGFIFAAVFSTRNFLKDLVFTKPGWAEWVVIAYVLIFAFNTLLRPPRLWGIVYGGHPVVPLSDIRLELVNSLIPSITLAKAESQEDGRFLLRGNKGSYILKISTKEGLAAEVPITIGSAGVVNFDIKLVWIN